jgi:NADH:ubiquinone oxidoreductase subunit 3 (subunit A)
MASILTPPIALAAYVILVAVLYGFGRLLAPARRAGQTDSPLYAGGEVAATHKAAPGYRRFFLVALFFAVLHLGALVLATAALTGGAAALSATLGIGLVIYLTGLVAAMVMLLLS